MKRGLYREEIKYLAIVTMTLNHIADGFLVPGSLLCEVFTDIGYLTAITMCYFLAEGYEKTRSRKAYLIRLLVFAVISQIPFTLCFGLKTGNMIATLAISFLILIVDDRFRGSSLLFPLEAGLILVSYFSDWGILAPLAALLFGKAQKGEMETRNVFFLMAGIYFVSGFYGRLMYDQGPVLKAFLGSVGAAAPILLSAFLILVCYNGKQANRFRAFHRWFFYLYYPLHLLILYGLRLSV